MTGSSDTCWHVIVVSGDEVLDIGYTLACLQEPEFTKCRFEVTFTEPEGEYQKDDLVVESWELYQKDPKEFWKQVRAK